MLQQAVQGITVLINVPGLINLDFADVQTVMIDKGIAHIGIGKAKGDDKAIEAVKQAVSSPLLETTIEGASHVIKMCIRDRYDCTEKIQQNRRSASCIWENVRGGRWEIYSGGSAIRKPWFG